MVPFRRVYAQPEIVEEGERDLFQLHGHGEGLGEERQVVHKWEQPGSVRLVAAANESPFSLPCSFFRSGLSTPDPIDC